MAEPLTADDAATLRSGLFWGCAAYTFWGLVTIYWKELEHFDAFELVGYRITSAAIVMAIYTAIRGQLGPIVRRLRDTALLKRVVFASLVLTANWTTYVWAVVHGKVIETALGYFITPIGLMIAGVVVLHEKMRRAQQMALALAIVAVVVLTIGYGNVPWVALLIASTWVTYSFVKKQSPLTAIESLTAETLVLFVPAVALVIFETTRAASAPHTASAGDWVLISFTGIVTTLPLLMFAVAARKLPLTTMALVQYIVPTINFMLGWLAYHERLNAVRVAGFVLVWIGLAIVSVDSLRRARATHHPAPPPRPSSPGEHREVDRPRRAFDLRERVGQPRPDRHRDTRRGPIRPSCRADARRGVRHGHRRSGPGRAAAVAPPVHDRHYGWEVPAGRVDEGETPVEAAAREALEETGWRPGPLTEIGRYFPYNGTSDGVFNLFLATSAEHVGEPTDPSESDRVEWVSWPFIRAEIAAGRVGDGLTLTALLWAHMNRNLADLSAISSRTGRRAGRRR